MIIYLYWSYLKKKKKDPKTEERIGDFTCDAYAAKSQIACLVSGFLVTLKVNVNSPKVS